MLSTRCTWKVTWNSLRWADFIVSRCSQTVLVQRVRWRWAFLRRKKSLDSNVEITVVCITECSLHFEKNYLLVFFLTACDSHLQNGVGCAISINGPSHQSGYAGENGCVEWGRAIIWRDCKFCRMQSLKCVQKSLHIIVSMVQPRTHLPNAHMAALVN